MTKLLVKVLTPPLLVPPLSVITTVTVLVPKECAAGWNVSVPLVAMNGNTVKAVLVALLVAVVVAKVQLWLLSLEGPALRLVRKPTLVTARVSSLTSSALVDKVKLGGWLTGVMVSLVVLVVDRLPSVATNVMVTLPLALVTGAKVRVKVALVALATLVPVTLTPARLVLEEVGTSTKLLETMS